MYVEETSAEAGVENVLGISLELIENCYVLETGSVRLHKGVGRNFFFGAS